jgi:hypothetical protein
LIVIARQVDEKPSEDAMRMIAGSIVVLSGSLLIAIGIHTTGPTSVAPTDAAVFGIVLGISFCALGLVVMAGKIPFDDSRGK